MLFELKEIIAQAILNQQKGLRNVLATVVHLEGSSYRKPGVRMLIAEDLSSVGAVSGGCVEKEIIRKSKSVFSDENPKIITYDGRFRLGCEGILYILIEPFFITNDFLNEFSKSISNREQLKINSYFKKKDGAIGNFGSQIYFKNNNQFTFSEKFSPKEKSEIFSQILEPTFKLIIIGGEHDAVKLCKTAANLGWEVTIITSAKDSTNIADFPGASAVVGETPETIQFFDIKENTAIVIMNHSYIQDLKYLIKLTSFRPKYIGILGSTKKREQLFNELFEYVPDLNDDFIDQIYAPAGLHIGAKTPEEIAVSIVAEILSVFRNKEPYSLRKLNGNVYSS